MSISFTPSQTILTTMCCTEAEFIRGAEYTSEGREALMDWYNDPELIRPTFPARVNEWGVDLWESDEEYQKILLAWRMSENRWVEKFDSAVILVDRAFGRFRKEFLFYTAGRCKLSAVREYHRYLIDALAPFAVRAEGF